MFWVCLGLSASQVKVLDQLTHPGVGTLFSPSPPNLQPPPPTAATAEVLQSLEGERFRSTAFLKLQCPNSPSNPSSPRRHQLSLLTQVLCRGWVGKETRLWRGSLPCRWRSASQTLARVKREETVPRASAVKPGCWDCSGGDCNGVVFF